MRNGDYEMQLWRISNKYSTICQKFLSRISFREIGDLSNMCSVEHTTLLYTTGVAVCIKCSSRPTVRAYVRAQVDLLCLCYFCHLNSYKQSVISFFALNCVVDVLPVFTLTTLKLHVKCTQDVHFIEEKSAITATC